LWHADTQTDTSTDSKGRLKLAVREPMCKRKSEAARKINWARHCQSSESTPIGEICDVSAGQWRREELHGWSLPQLVMGSHAIATQRLFCAVELWPTCECLGRLIDHGKALGICLSHFKKCFFSFSYWLLSLFVRSNLMMMLCSC